MRCVSQCPLDGAEATYIWSAVDLRDHVVQGRDQRIWGSSQVGVAVQEKVQSSSRHLVTSFQDCKSCVGLSWADLKLDPILGAPRPHGV